MGISHWRRRRRDWSVTATNQSRRPKMACALTKARRRLQTRWQPIRPEVAGTSPRSLRQSPQRLLSLLGLQQVSETSVETSPQSRTKLVSATLPQLMETSPRPAGDWKKSPKKNRTCLNLPGDPASLQETSQRRLHNQRRLESPPGRHLVSRPMR